EIEVGELAKLRMFAVPLLLTGGEVHQIIEMPHITFAQKPVLKHRAQRWRERHREFERHRVVHQAVHHPQQRNVSLRHRLEEPVFLEKVLMFRVSNERQVRVENEGKETHCRFQISNCRLAATTPNLKSAICNLQLQRPAKILETNQTFFDYVDAGGVADQDGAIVAKSDARYDRVASFALEMTSEVSSTGRNVAACD